MEAVKDGCIASTSIYTPIGLLLFLEIIIGIAVTISSTSSQPSVTDMLTVIFLGVLGLTAYWVIWLIAGIVGGIGYWYYIEHQYTLPA